MRVINHETFMVAMEPYMDRWEVKGQYKSQKDHVAVKCLECHTETTVRASSLINGSGCNTCRLNGGTTKTHEQFMKEVREKNVHLNILGTYRGNKIHIECQCVYCGNIHTKTPSMILQGQQCRKCSHNSRRKTHEQFMMEVTQANSTVEVLDEFSGYDMYMSVRCKKCSREYKTTGRTLLAGHGCKVCSVSLSEDKKREIERTLKELEHPHTILEPYRILNDTVRVKCDLCLYERNVRLASLLENTRGCVKCSQSTKEKHISALLDELQVDYFVEHKFKDALTPKGNPFKFDFYIPEKALVIEYDGEYHYKDRGIPGEDRRLEIVQEYDRLKNEYAEGKGIVMLRVNYFMTDEEINNEIMKYLDK